MKIYTAFVVGMATQIALAMVANAVTYHVVPWQSAAGVLIAVAVFAGTRITAPAKPAKPRKEAKDKFQQELDEFIYSEENK